PVRPRLIKVTRVLGAILVAVLVFQFFPFGRGGGGGGGSGGGTGAGVGSKKGNGSSQAAAGKKVDDSKKVQEGVAAATETLAIDMIASKRYEDDERFYLLKGQEPPRTLGEIEKYIQANKGRLQKVDIVIYPDSVSRLHYAVTALRKVITDAGLTLREEYPAKRQVEA